MLYNQRAIMAEIYANRRARLRQLIEEQFEGNQSAMARTAGYRTSTYFSALLKSLPMGQRAARQIEVKLGLPKAWMDTEPPPGAVPNTPYKARLGHPRIEASPSLREILNSAGYTQREIARQLGVHESTVSRALKRERAAEKKHKRRVAA